MRWDAFQREWRTPPLWGVADSGPWLHDGRADTLDAAIRWHAGEAADAARNYRALSKDERQRIIAFLKTLRAPSELVRNQVDKAKQMKLTLAEGNLDLLQRKAEFLNVFDSN